MAEDKRTAELPAERSTAPGAPKTPAQVQQSDLDKAAQRVPLANQVPGTNNQPGQPKPLSDPGTPGRAPASPTPTKLENKPPQDLAQATTTPPPSQTITPAPVMPIEPSSPPAGPSKDTPEGREAAEAPREVGGPVGLGPLTQETRPMVSIPDDPEKAAEILGKKEVLASQVQVSPERAAEERKAQAEQATLEAGNLSDSTKGQPFAAPAGVQQRVR